MLDVLLLDSYVVIIWAIGVTLSSFYLSFACVQEDTADELAESIVQFVSSLPVSVRKVEEEPIPEHIQKMFDEAEKNGHHHHRHHGDAGHDHHHDGHEHGHAGYMDAYGLGQGHAW